MKKYRLKDEKFRKPAEAIACITEELGLSLEHFVSREGSGIRERLKEYGVFDLWFEEVPKYKAGDYIVAVGAGQRDKARKIANCKVADDRLIWSEYGDIGEGFAHAWKLSKIRHATAEEIEEYKKQLPFINGYRGKLKYNYIVYGCKSIHIQDFITLYETCIDLEVSSITIEGQEIKIETMQEIYEKCTNTMEENINYLIDKGIATENEITLVTKINGYSQETLNSILYVRTRYRNFEQIKEENGNE